MVKKRTRKDIEQEIEKFGLEAEHLPQKPENKRVYKTITFSLTEEISREIDMLALVPRTFRASRSDVVKAGIAALKRMKEEEYLALLNEIKQRD